MFASKRIIDDTSVTIGTIKKKLELNLKMQNKSLTIRDICTTHYGFIFTQKQDQEVKRNFQLH